MYRERERKQCTGSNDLHRSYRPPQPARMSQPSSYRKHIIRVGGCPTQQCARLTRRPPDGKKKYSRLPYSMVWAKNCGLANRA